MTEFLLLFVFAIFSGCDKVSSEPKKPDSERLVQSLRDKAKAIPSKEESHYDKENKDNVAITEWIDISYDVQKTDSLVSPYLGIVSMTYKKSFKSSEETYESQRWKLEIILAAQEGKWKLKEIYGTPLYSRLVERLGYLESLRDQKAGMNVKKLLTYKDDPYNDAKSLFTDGW